MANIVPRESVAAGLNRLLENSGIKGRINELLGKRAPQFVGSIVSLITADENLTNAFHEAPMTIIQAALRAATYDLPIDPTLGFAYIVPYKNKQKDDSYRTEASFILGYRGMYQLAMRTGAYKKLNVVDIREGELKSYNRLTEDMEFEFYADEEQRSKKPIVGYCGFFRLVNGMEKFVYMSVKEIAAHEEKNRKGKYPSKGWRDNKEAMSAKTVLRKLIGKWGIMSIDYQTASPAVIAAAQSIASGNLDDDDNVMTFEEQQEVMNAEVAAELEEPKTVDFTDNAKTELPQKVLQPEPAPVAKEAPQAVKKAQPSWVK